MGAVVTTWFLGFWAPLAGLATIATVALTWRCLGRKTPAFQAALMLATFWVIAQFVDAWVDPLIDTAGFYTALSIWFARRGRGWAGWLAVAFGAQLVTHFVFQDPDSLLRWAVLYALYAAQLLIVCEPCAPESLRRPVRHLLGFGPPSRAARLARTR